MNEGLVRSSQLAQKNGRLPCSFGMPRSELERMLKAQHGLGLPFQIYKHFAKAGPMIRIFGRKLNRLFEGQ